MDTLLKGLGVFVLFIAILAIVVVFTAVPVMLIVNHVLATALVVAVFGTTKIGFWTAYWFSFLCGILFKGGSYSGKS